MELEASAPYAAMVAILLGLTFLALAIRGLWRSVRGLAGTAPEAAQPGPCRVRGELHAVDHPVRSLRGEAGVGVRTWVRQSAPGPAEDLGEATREDVASVVLQGGNKSVGVELAGADWQGASSWQSECSREELANEAPALFEHAGDAARLFIVQAVIHEGAQALLIGVARLERQPGESAGYRESEAATVVGKHPAAGLVVDLRRPSRLVAGAVGRALVVSVLASLMIVNAALYLGARWLELRLP